MLSATNDSKSKPSLPETKSSIASAIVVIVSAIAASIESIGYEQLGVGLRQKRRTLFGLRMLGEWPLCSPMVHFGGTRFAHYQSGRASIG